MPRVDNIHIPSVMVATSTMAILSVSGGDWTTSGRWGRRCWLPRPLRQIHIPTARLNHHFASPGPIRWKRPFLRSVRGLRNPWFQGLRFRAAPCKTAGLEAAGSSGRARAATLWTRCLPNPLMAFKYFAGGGECPEWQRGRTVNPLAYAFVGSSPTSPTISRRPVLCSHAEREGSFRAKTAG
jgi:hypothetical protein